MAIFARLNLRKNNKMSLRKLFPIILAVALTASADSCKKEDSKSQPSLDGMLTFDLPAFIKPNEVLIMAPKGLKHPEGKPIGYAWRVTPGMEKSDTVRYTTGLSPEGRESDGSFRYHFPDSIGTYTVNCYGFAKDYNSTYASSYTTVVIGGLDGSITGTGIASSDSRITNEGTYYYYTTHNGLDWFRNNLENSSFGVSYTNSDAMLHVFGNFYSYEEAMKACPDGWRLPTDSEWVELANSIKPEADAVVGEPIKGIAADFMANVSFNGTEMWEYWPEVGEISNSSKLAAIPAGYANLGERDENGKYPAALFSGVYEYAAFWTADKVEGESNMAYYRYIICDQPDMQIGKGEINTFGANVRCVRERQ